ncbi:MAG: YvcK family protein [Firmicutes bacterium]|nr:YvcK family protein [Bacillota bacterium]
MRNYIGRHGLLSSGGPRLAVIGGGTGLSVLLRGLKKRTTNISAIVTVTDDGGGSGVIRDELGMLPPGDVRSCILSLADDEDIMEQLLQYRFSEGSLRGQNMGNLILAGLTEIMGDFEAAVNKLQDILRIKGQVIPVTSTDTILCAELKNGKVVRGESHIPVEVRKCGSPIKRVFLDPKRPEALPSAVNAIRSADMIVLGPGSLYSSIIPNLLVEGISEALREAKGIRVLMCNVMTQAGETDDYTVGQYAQAVEKYLGPGVIEYILINDYKFSDGEIESYLKQGMRQMLAGDADRILLKEMGIQPIENHMIALENGIVRHDADRVTGILMSLIHV